MFARLIYFGSLLKAAAVILITIYLFISYLPNGIVWSHAPPPHCQLNFLLAAGTQSIPLLFSFARAKFVWEELAVKKRLELCSACGAWHALAAGERKVLQVDVVETPLSMLIGSAIGIDFAICSPPEFHNKYATRLQDECASV